MSEANPQSCEGLACQPWLNEAYPKRRYHHGLCLLAVTTRLTQLLAGKVFTRAEAKSYNTTEYSTMFVNRKHKNAKKNAS